jgi:hypothetical protein
MFGLTQLYVAMAHTMSVTVGDMIKINVSNEKSSILPMQAQVQATCDADSQRGTENSREPFHLGEPCVNALETERIGGE